MKYIYYKKGFKYQSTRERRIQTHILGYEIETDYCKLDKSGLLIVFPKYAWDGASKFPDFKWIMLGAFFHDVGYQMIREGVIPRETKMLWDGLLGRCCIDSGAYVWVARSVVKAVGKFGKAAAHPNNRRRELCAP